MGKGVVNKSLAATPISPPVLPTAVAARCSTGPSSGSGFWSAVSGLCLGVKTPITILDVKQCAQGDHLRLGAGVTLPSAAISSDVSLWIEPLLHRCLLWGYVSSTGILLNGPRRLVLLKSFRRFGGPARSRCPPPAMCRPWTLGESELRSRGLPDYCGLSGPLFRQWGFTGSRTPSCCPCICTPRITELSVGPHPLREASLLILRAQCVCGGQLRSFFGGESLRS